MDYTSIHNKIINNAHNRVLEGYCERHHIVPRCMGGGNEKTNIVILTAREHYVIHQLLVKIYPTVPGLAAAAKMMTMDSSGGRVNNKLYGWLKERHSVEHSSRMKGKKKGPWSKERRLAKSNAMKGNVPWNKGRATGPRSENTKASIRDGMIGVNLGRKLGPHSPESNRQRALTLTGVTHEIVNCSYCDKSGGVRGMKRWHFDNCKHRPSLT